MGEPVKRPPEGQTDVGNEYGRWLEERARAALGASRVPWIFQVVQTEAYSKADRDGVDVNVRTDVGWIGLQVKSRSRGRRPRKWYEGRGIAYVKVWDTDSDEEVLRRAYLALADMRQRYIAKAVLAGKEADRGR